MKANYEDRLNKAINVNTAGTNLNDYKSDGEFYFGTDYTPTNIPAGVNGWLRVITGKQGNDNVVKQIWYRHGTPNSNDYETYVRTFSGNTWSNWSRYAAGGKLEIKTKTITNETIGAYGNIPLNLYSSSAIVLAVNFNGGYTGIPILFGGIWYCYVVKNQAQNTLNLQTSGTISGTVYYVEL